MMLGWWWWWLWWKYECSIRKVQIIVINNSNNNNNNNNSNSNNGNNNNDDYDNNNNNDNDKLTILTKTSKRIIEFETFFNINWDELVDIMGNKGSFLYSVLRILLLFRVVIVYSFVLFLKIYWAFWLYL